jgi:hypothetical protein
MIEGEWESWVSFDIWIDDEQKQTVQFVDDRSAALTTLESKREDLKTGI